MDDYTFIREFEHGKIPLEKHKDFIALKNKLRTIKPGSEVFTPSRILLGSLKNLINGSVIDLPVSIYDKAQHGKCHSVSAYLWLQNPSITVYDGFCYVNGSWYDHTFVSLDGTIIEPTPLVRTIYFGRPLSEEETRIFVYNEIVNIIDIKSKLGISKTWLTNKEQELYYLGIPTY